MRMQSQRAMVASQMKRAANDKAIAQMLAAKKSGPPAARLDDEIQHKSFLGALAGAVLGAIVTIAEGCLIMAACATGPYALVLVPALMYASYRITSVSHTDGIRLKLTYHASGYLKAIHRTDNGIPLRPPRQPAGVHGR
ncbi:RHS repeat domain-containing protein [Escherichia coli]